jgi:hypothetical protein
MRFDLTGGYTGQLHPESLANKQRTIANKSVSLLVAGMLGVYRVTIKPDLIRITTLLYGALERVVTLTAQTLQFTKFKPVPVAIMRFNVIRYAGRHHKPSCQMHLAQRMRVQLRLAPFLPAQQPIPTIGLVVMLGHRLLVL